MFRAKLTIALMICATVWPSGAYAITDPTSPVVTQASAPQDLRSPDARDAARTADASKPQDLRSPDARDAARERPVAHTESSGASPSRTARSASDGFEWGDAGIGAAVMLALVSLASGTVLLAGRSRHRTPTT